MVMKRLFLGSALLFLGVGGWATVQGQGGVIGPPGDCEYNCFEILVMAGVSGGEPYCWGFGQPTGRMVWAAVPPNAPIGGLPVAEANCSQDATRFNNCAPGCPTDKIPQVPATWNGAYGTLGFGCYDCGG
jgi:hypothetical protein